MCIKRDGSLSRCTLSMRLPCCDPLPVLRYHAIIRPLFYPRALPPPTSGPVVYFADLSIDIRDFQFSNGVIGKVVTDDMTERD